jgi:hypothetical protein
MRFGFTRGGPNSGAANVSSLNSFTLQTGGIVTSQASRRGDRTLRSMLRKMDICPKINFAQIAIFRLQWRIALKTQGETGVDSKKLFWGVDHKMVDPPLYAFSKVNL